MDKNTSIFRETYKQPFVRLRDLLDDEEGDDGNMSPKYFRIPIYQRGYAWGIRQCYELWDDIERVKNTGKSHYIGTLSLSPNDSSEEKECQSSRYVYDIVDGQQRFTTLMIILRLLTERVRVLQNGDEKDIEKYIGSERSRKFQYTYSNAEARKYLEERLYKLDANRPLNNNVYFANIESAIEFFNDDRGYDRKFDLFCNKKNYPKKHNGRDIKNMDEQQAKAYIDVVLDKLIFNVVIVDANDVNTVFESMNNRGKEPTKLEILKNRLMYLTSYPPLKDKINQTWSEIYSSLGASPYTKLGNEEFLICSPLSDDEFLKCHWYMYHGAVEKQNKNDHLYQIFDEEFAPSRASDPDVEKDIESYVESLSKSIAVWRFLNIPSAGTTDVPTNVCSNKVRPYVEKLSRLVSVNSQSFLKSFILAILCCDRLPEDDLADTLDFVEKYIFITWGMRKKKQISSSWATQANSVYTANKKGDIAGLKNAIATLKAEKTQDLCDTKQDDGTVSEGAITAALKEFYDIKQNKDGYYGWHSVYYFLFEYDLHVRKRSQEGVPELEWYTWDSIEHIFPESPNNDYWKEAFAPYLQHDACTRVLMHSLGNLLPLERGNNSSLKNANYHTKCNGDGNSNKFYYRNGCASARELIETYGDRYWTPTQIYKRIDAMSEFLYTTWIKPFVNSYMSISAQDIAANLKIPYEDLPQASGGGVKLDVPSDIPQDLKDKLDAAIGNTAP